MFLVNSKEDYLSLITNICSTKQYIPSLFGTYNTMTILNLKFQYYVALSPIYRDITFNIILFIVDIRQILTVRRELIFARLDSK